MIDSRDGPTARQNTFPASGSSQARSNRTPSSAWMARSASCASRSWMAVTPKNPECTSMNVDIAPPDRSSGRHLRPGVGHTLAVGDGRVIGRSTDDVRRPRPTLRAMTTALEPILSPILVGRDEHLELADARLQDALAGRGSTLLVAGEAG